MATANPPIVLPLNPTTTCACALRSPLPPPLYSNTPPALPHSGDVRPLHFPWSAPPHVAYISNLAVDSSQRKRGVGSRLLRAAEAVSSGWGFGEVYLHVALAEDRLLAFYQRQQYAPLPEMDAPPWVLAISGREATRYHVRKLDSEPVERLAAAADAIKAARPRRGERG